MSDAPAITLGLGVDNRTCSVCHESGLCAFFHYMTNLVQFRLFVCEACLVDLHEKIMDRKDGEGT